ncbi:zf-HC2 domain-containing protein [Streptomyces tauricus]|uniref:Zf-HC2 domain-containing protein n=1 Tax=Streptomyces tauricus TaxID=68274 RepID=A0ABZ1JB58_9ACTN|nr:zf-HC2 domain-containing protein [Streptomyces tauricus]
MSGEHASERAHASGREHASGRVIEGYAHGGTDLAADEVWAVEAHLEACRVCRDRLSAVVAVQVPAVTSLVGAVWSGLEPRLAVTATMRRGRLQQAWLSRLSRLSRWMTPAMVPWLAMVVAVTLLALLLDLVGVGTGEVSLVLLFAPVLPVLGVAASWARGLDPAYELTASAPRAGLQLVLRRTASVLGVVVPVLLVCGWLTGVMVAQWLLPCLAFTAATLALGGAVGVTRAAVVLAAGWAVLILAPTLATSRTALALRTDGLPAWALLLVLGTGVVIARRGAYSVLRTHR